MTWPGRRLMAAVTGGVVLLLGGGLVWVAFQSGFESELVASLFGDMPTSQELSGTDTNLDTVVVQINLGAKDHAISPYIYGVAGADPDVLLQLGATLNRWGGNPSSRYNWLNGHAWNAGRDWEFRNVNYGSSNDPQADLFVREATTNHVAPLLTVPTIGWVARDDQNNNRSTGVPSEGGAPVAPGSSAIAGYDPTANRARTSVMSLPRNSGQTDVGAHAVYQDQWIQHLVTTFGADAIRFLTMDNEPDLWSSTHTDVHPVRVGYDDMLSMFEDYATAVKSVAPTALILGPDVSGWTGYFYSDLDRGTDNFGTHADRRAHGDQAFLPWWLAQVAKQDRQRGSRSLDLLDVHYYPQESRVTSTANDPMTQYLRIQSVRSLYDPTFSDPSWIAEPVRLIPRLKDWIAANYRGTGLAITEYNWGGENDASGAVALADSLGVFGREGVEVAAYWRYPKPSSPAGAAFRMYRNFDGKGGHFGDRSLVTKSSAQAVQAFAARDSATGVISVMLINESFDKTAKVLLDTKAGGRTTAEVYRLHRGSAEIESDQLTDWRQPISLAPLSVTLVRLPAGSAS